MLPGAPKSLYEIGFMIMGRPAIYYISLVIFANAAGLTLIYFIIFGDTIKSLIISFYFDEKEVEGIFTVRTTYVLILGAVLFPILILKELKELKIAAVLLFIAVFSFIFIIILQLI